ncbi:glycosyltransferase family 2 protein [Pseudogemmobacter faecipullorum]|uniref:Glycosyltransferase n=1 Tax=Pseudogemmobacter faecipullorum TaxID=2755041 RepID=A0ABS8CMG0_9RHOB|nr:glycosyltransferase family 2 protein [Pseudogemmobacter faecipullorum]MCB5410581.1 glycosyltransferase [Pseudogemmobacter faecipullorum]
MQAAARHYGLSHTDPCQPLPVAALIDQLGAEFCQRHRLLPLRRTGAAVLLATSRPHLFAGLRPGVEARLGPVQLTLAPSAALTRALHLTRGARIAARAESRPPVAESCRGWGGAGRIPASLALLALSAAIVLQAPLLSGLILLATALLAMISTTLLKLCAALTALRHPPRPAPPLPGRALPKVSLLVALCRESDIAPRLVRRLSRLDYPRDRLEVLLAIEAGDDLTRKALAGSDLPGWMRIVLVPPGQVMTKPRALNVALDHSDGEVIGIYDAEDAPEPDQIRRIMAELHHGPENLACIQGVLDFYNPGTNWLSRCFTLEYAAWFRLILPGIARMGLMVPLGGTSLFIRREVLEALGAWDSHNVTEDADLGIRLARHGYQTRLSRAVTREEANCRAWPWIRQRSRWIKGHMMTWGVHMRRPGQLRRQIGWRAFLGFQVMFLGAALQSLLAPLLWSCWLLALGLPHPLATALPPPLRFLMIAAFLLCAAVDATLALLALRQSGQKLSRLWVLTLYPYQALASFAAAKALWEMIFRPFYWDKTSHGLFDENSAGPP